MRLRVVSPRRWRLQTSLALTIIALAALLVLVTMVVERALLRERIEAELENSVAVSRIAAAEVDRFLGSIESTTLAVAQLLAVEPFNKESYNAYLGSVFASTGARSLVVTDLDGRVIASASGEGIGTDLSTRPYLQVLRDGARTVWSDEPTGAQSGEMTVAFGRAITSPGGSPRSYLVASFTPAALMARLLESLASDARLTLLDRRGIVIYTSAGGPLPPAERDLSGRPNIQRALKGEVVKLYGPRAPITEDARYGALVPIPRTGWVLAFSRPLAPLESRLRTPFGRQRRLLVGAIVAVGVLGFAISLRLIRPLAGLARAAGAIARGERPRLPDVAGPNEVAELAAGMAAMSRAVAEREDTIRLIAEAGKQLSASLDYGTILRDLARLTVPRVADWCIIYLLGSDGTVRRVEIAHVEPGKEALVGRLAAHTLKPGGQHPIMDVIQSGRSKLLPEITEEALRRSSPDDEQRLLAREVGFTSAMLVPMMARGKALGAISFVTSVSQRRYTPADLAIAEELTQRAALAVDNARAYERERKIAETLQRSLLPARLPEVPGVSLASRYLPAGPEVEVGGDWYDAMILPNGGLALVMGDVAGRGVQAAAVMGQLQNAVRAYAAEGYGPAAILQRVGRMLNLREMATLLILTFDPTTRAVQYANAGHLPPLVVAPDGSVTALEGGAPPLSPASADLAYVDRSAVLAPDSTLLLYTDGLVEVRGEAIDAGIERLTTAVREVGNVEPDALLDHVLSALLQGEAAPDDVALLALHAGSLDPAALSIRLDASPPSVPLMRNALRRWLGLSHLDPAEIFDVTVAASEAFSNAIEHAYGAGDASIELDARLDGGVIRLSIRDWGRWREHRGQNRGRGLALMQGLMDEVDVAAGEEGTIVRMQRRMRPQVPA